MVNNIAPTSCRGGFLSAEKQNQTNPNRPINMCDKPLLLAKLDPNRIICAGKSYQNDTTNAQTILSTNKKPDARVRPWLMSNLRRQELHNFVLTHREPG